MSKLFVQPLHHDNLIEIVDFAVAQNYNLEIASFAYANAFEMDWQKVLQMHIDVLRGFKGKISFHGVFQDVLVHSSDAMIAEVSQKRIFESIKTASTVGAKQIVFHGNFNPFISDPFYFQFWVERNAAFWKKTLKSFDGVILLENLWESSPEALCKLLETINESRLKVCFDVAHANVFSKLPMDKWIEMLGSKIQCLHYSDNNGLTDQHLEVGAGKIDWTKLTSLLEKQGLEPEVVFEIGELRKIEKSIKYLKDKRIYPLSNKK